MRPIFYAVSQGTKLISYKQYLKGMTKIIKIKVAVGLAKCIIYYKVIAITNYYKTVVGKVFFFITIDTKIFFQSADA